MIMLTAASILANPLPPAAARSALLLCIACARSVPLITGHEDGGNPALR